MAGLGILGRVAHRCGPWAYLLALLLAGLLPGILPAAATPITWPTALYNPQPQSGDVLLPLPCGGAMAFRAVPTPGRDAGYPVVGPFTGADGSPYLLLGKYEVSELQARAMGRAPPSDSDWGWGDRPVINVSWEDAVAYTAWLAQATGEKYRLPSEAEWEYAARAGFATPFWTGKCINTDQANYIGNHDYAGCGAKTGVYRQQTVSVGSLPANPWGLHEVHGNVWEWVADPYHDSYKGAPVDGSAWEAGAVPRGWCAAAPGSAFRGSCVAPSAAGTGPATATPTSVFGSP